MKSYSWLAALVAAALGACAPEGIPTTVAVVGCPNPSTSCEEQGSVRFCFTGTTIGVCCPASSVRNGSVDLALCATGRWPTAMVQVGGTCSVSNNSLPGLCAPVTPAGDLDVCLPNGDGGMRACTPISRTANVAP